MKFKTLVILSSLFIAGSVYAGGNTFPDNYTVLGCSMAIQGVAAASFARQPNAPLLVTDIVRDEQEQGQHRVYASVLDGTRPNELCTGEICVEDGTGLVKEVLIKTFPQNQAYPAFSDEDLKKYATQAALAVHRVRRADADRNTYVDHAQFSTSGNYPWYGSVYQVAIHDGASGDTMYYDVEFAPQFDTPVVRVTARGTSPY